MQEYDLKNGEHRVQFAGELLSKRSSQQGITDLRWTEIEIYKTQGGKYIIHKIGRSVVIHRTGQSCSSGPEIPLSHIDEDARDCPRCLPKKTLSGGMVTHEVDRHTVHVSYTAHGAVESCYTQDGDKVAYLTYPARAALTEASAMDEDIRDAFMVQRVE